MIEDRLSNGKQVYTVRDLMDILQIGRNAAYSLINNKEIKSLKIGRSIRIPNAYLNEYLGNTQEICYNTGVMVGSSSLSLKGAS